MSVLAALIAAFIAGFLGTLAMRGFARRHGLVVAPRADRWHDTPTALYGGVSIATATWVGVLAGGEMELGAGGATAGVLLAASVLLVIGVIDDARGIGPVGKFILQLAAGTLLVATGLVYPLTPWEPVNVLATLLWYTGVVNALNLLDNMDGAAAGVGGVAALGFATLFGVAGEPALTAVALAAAGAAAGFLVFNFKPASIFMGDGGSLFLGGILAGLGIAYPLVDGAAGGSKIIVPVLLLVVPILDTGLVMVTRTLNSRRISMGGRDHSTHRLVAMGFSEARAAIMLYLLGAAGLAVACAVRVMATGAGFWLASLFLAGVVVFAGYLGLLHQYDPGSATERRRGPIFREILLRRRGLVLLLDVVLFGVAYYGAFVIYYEGGLSAEMVDIAGRTLSIVIVLKLAAFHYFRVYRAAWSRAGLADVHRIVKATLLSGLLVIASLFLMARGAEIPRTVFVLDILLTAGLAMMARSSVRSLERFRRRLRPSTGLPVLVWGAGAEADLVLHALNARREYLDYRVVGLVDDREAVGTLIQGIPVVGPGSQLERLLERVQPYAVILADPLPSGEPGRLFQERCAAADVPILVMTLGLSELDPEARTFGQAAPQRTAVAR